MNSISYRAYLVTNVLLDRKITSPGYDFYSLMDEIPRREQQDIQKRVYTDITFANWANFDQGEKSALTLYMPLPYQGSNQHLFYPKAREKYEGLARERLQTFLPELGLSDANVVGVRMTRYGHAMPVAWIGSIASGLAEKSHAAIDNKIFFANQDNWVNPVFETAFETGRQAALRILES